MPVSQPSLPPAASDTALSPSSPEARALAHAQKSERYAPGPLRYCPNPACKRPCYVQRRKKCSVCQTELPKIKEVRLAADTIQVRTAMQAVAMRIAGHSDEDIAKNFGITVGSLRSYISRAARDGHFTFDDAKERLEHEIAHKAVDNLSALLDSDDPAQLERVTMRTLEGTTFRKFQEAPPASPQSNILQINIGVPNTDAPLPVRPGSILSAEVIEGEVRHVGRVGE
jgi:transposase